MLFSASSRSAPRFLQRGRGISRATALWAHARPTQSKQGALPRRLIQILPMLFRTSSRSAPRFLQRGRGISRAEDLWAHARPHPIQSRRPTPQGYTNPAHAFQGVIPKCPAFSPAGPRDLPRRGSVGPCPPPPNPTRATYPAGLYNSCQSRAKSSHRGFIDSTSRTFLLRLQPLISFSRAIAASG